MKKYRVILTLEEEKWFDIEAENRADAAIEAKRRMAVSESEILKCEVDEIYL